MNIGCKVHGYGPTKVLFLHGWLSDHTIFSSVLPHLDHARVGSALYGVETAPANLQGFAPVATLRAPVLRVAEVAAGAEVGYGGVYRLPVSATLATLAIGYGHGLPIHLGDRGSVVLAGQTVPIVGGVSRSS